MIREETKDVLINLRKTLVDNVASELDINEIEAIDTVIEALEQEPFINKPCVSEGICREDKMAMLDKIRAEIEELPKTYPFVNHLDKYVKEDDVLQIIDRYKAESEDV